MREHILASEIARVDGTPPLSSTGKHAKMAMSPFVFYRGTAQLFYADLRNGVITRPSELDKIPLTSVVGDCHAANFGFLTEEGSHGDTVIFAPNDFDDACVGRSYWDILRFMTSLHLVYEHCKTPSESICHVEDDVRLKPVINTADVLQAQSAFLDQYVDTCRRVLLAPSVIREAQDTRPDKTPSKLAKLFDKAVARSASGPAFTSKSALARAVQLNDGTLAFIENRSKFTPLSPDNYKNLYTAFAPYMDDNVVDIVQRINAGTGSVNLARYYFLVGPTKPHNETHFASCHIVEVKQQRDAAPLHYFPSLNPVNRLNAAHLTARSQRRMQRNPDLILDEARFEDAHYLIRSRHHAKVGIDPEDIATGKKAVAGGFVYFAELCGYTLALAHCRGDRRSTRFAAASVNYLDRNKNSLVSSANIYANQVIEDYNWFVDTIKSK